MRVAMIGPCLGRSLRALSTVALMTLLVSPISTAYTAVAVAATDSSAISAAERSRVIRRLADLLELRYFDPEAGRRYAVSLRRRLMGNEYQLLDDRRHFAARLTANLQEVQPDLHPRVAVESEFHRLLPIPVDTPSSAHPNGAPGIETAEVLPGNIVYIRFNEFPDDPKVAALARAIGRNLAFRNL